MKPNFALNLSHEGISLLHRAKTGWMRVGDVALDAPDLDTQLTLLRQTAADLENGGVTTKLVIPNSQILYAEVEAPGPDTAARISQIRDGLVGLTPYDVADLVFDWRLKGTHARVAVVARDTLREAEGFANEYKFNPVSFVAVPVNGAFDGEPYFGPTRHASNLLVDGEAIEPDNQRIEILGQEKSKTPPTPKAQPTAKPARADASKPPAPQEKPAPNAVLKALDDATPPALAADAATSPAPQAKPDTDVDLPVTAFASRRTQIDSPAARPGAIRTEPRISFSAVADDPATTPPVKAPVIASVTAATLDTAELPDLPDRQNGAVRNTPAFDLPGEQRPGAIPALYSKPKPAKPPAAKAKPAPANLAAAKPAAKAAAAPAKPALPMTAPHTADAVDPRDKAAKRRRQTKQKAKKAGAAVMGSIGKLARKKPEAANQKSKPFVTNPTAADAQAQAQAMTVFGARGRAPQRGKPKYLGLVLTLLLLVALAVLALWSTYFVNDVTSGLFGTIEDEPEITAPAIVPQPDPVDPNAPRETAAAPIDPEPLQSPIDAAIETALAEPDPTETIVPDPVIPDPVIPDPVISDPVAEDPIVPDPVVQDPVVAEPVIPDPVIPDPDPDPVQPEIADSVPDTPAPEDFALLQQPEIPALPALPEPETPVVVPDPIISAPERQPPPTPAEAQARYAATGIWQLDPPPLVDVPGGGDQLDDVYIASIDPEIGVPDAVALPNSGGLDTDLRPDALNPPAPLGTIFDFDQRGLVRATPEGAVTPSGVPVFSGAPAVVPGPRPADLKVPVDETQLLEDKRLEGLRPTSRPGGLEESNERARLGGFSNTELAAIRPRVRPVSLEQPRGSIIDILLETVQEDTRTAAIDPIIIGDDVTALAVAASRAPPVRPSNFKSVVERALLEATRAPPKPLAETRQTKVLASAAVAAPRMPKIPSRTSVAKQATVRNAINLGRVNLIGIYGSPAKRRALVRLSSGKYIKVEVGDKVDGGRVAAIGSNELRYVKRGRNVTLKMPKG